MNCELCHAQPATRRGRTNSSTCRQLCRACFEKCAEAYAYSSREKRDSNQAKLFDLADEQNGTTLAQPFLRKSRPLKMREKMRLEVGYREVPPGIYTAEIAAIDLKKTDFGDRLVWRFKILEGEHEGEEVIRFTSAKATPKSACGQFLKALGITSGELDTDELKGEPVRIVVVANGDKTRVETIQLNHDLAR